MDQYLSVLICTSLSTIYTFQAFDIKCVFVHLTASILPSASLSTVREQRYSFDESKAAAVYLPLSGTSLIQRLRQV